MSNNVKTKTVNLGRLPVFCGLWRDGVGYHKYNIVTYYGSSFINLVEGNLKYPVKIVLDSSNRLESYSFEYIDGSWTGWMFISNAYDASIYAMNMGDYAKAEADRANKSYSGITITIVPDIIYAGTNTTVSISANVSTLGEVSTFTLSRNGTQIAQSTTTSIKYTTTINATEDQVIVADAQINGINVTDNATIRVVYPVYYGSGDSYTDASTKATLRTEPDGSYIINIPEDGKYIFFNVPEDMNIDRVTLSGLDMRMDESVYVTIDNKRYKSYKSACTYDAGTLNLLVNIG